VVERVRVKICGVIDPENARQAVDLGADYLGLNFYPPSPRFVEIERAREIADAVRGRVPLVGVFVNRPRAEIEEIAERVGLDLIQMSGDETPADLAPFADRAIKGFRGVQGGMDPGGAALAPYESAWGWLFDAPHRTLYGGTGAAWDYGAVAGIGNGRRVFLAGGIGPDNVRRAAEALRPHAVDICSRVESAPGIKDIELLERLFEEVRNVQSSSTDPS
jgi:phosphoribosylanthranilate isomerase